MNIIALQCEPAWLERLTSLLNSASTDEPLAIITRNCGSLEELLEEAKTEPEAGLLVVQFGSPLLGELSPALQAARINLPLLGIDPAPAEGKLQFDLWDPMQNQGLPGLQEDQVASAIHGLCQRQRLQSMVTAQSKELARCHEQLARSNDAACRSLDQMAHELRTPLTVLEQYGSLLGDELDGPLTRRQRDYVSIMRDRILELTARVDDLLDLRKIQLGQLGVRRQVFDIRPRIAGVVSRVQRRAVSKQIEIEFQWPEKAPRVFADQERLQRTLQFLLSNAVAANDPGSVISITAEYLEEEQLIQVSIADPFRPTAVEEMDEAMATLQSMHIGFDPLESRIRGTGFRVAEETMRRSLGELKIASSMETGTLIQLQLPTYDVPALVKRFVQSQTTNRKFESFRLTEIKIENCGSSELDAYPLVDDFLQHSQFESGLILPLSQRSWLWLSLSIEGQDELSVEHLQSHWQQVQTSSPVQELPRLETSTLLSSTASDAIVDAVNTAMASSAQTTPAQQRVLLADGNIESLSGLMARLESFGYEVVSAMDGEGCIREALSARPDAILLDANLANSSGQQAYLDLLNNGDTRNLPILMLAEDLKDQQEVLDHGVHQVLRKPLDARRLKSTFANLFQTSSVVTAPHAASSHENTQAEAVV